MFFILPAITGIVLVTWMIFILANLHDAPEPIIKADVFGEAGMKTESIELTREIFGLLIVFVWMGILAFFKIHKKTVKYNSFCYY